MSGDEVMISMKSGTKAFGKVIAFENLSFEVRRNECLCLVGPSGCGKTSLLRVIDGLTPLTRGVVSVAGKVVEGPTPEIAMVFQHFGLFPWMTVEDNVSYGLRVKGVNKAQRKERASQYIELVGLGGFEASYPYQLSGGMQQRVGLARALTLEPTVLLMDEPFASVDAQTREILQEQLLEIWERERRTMVFITHSIEESILMGDRVAVLSTRPGRIKDTLDIPFGHPRKVAEVVADPRFAELRNRVWSELKSEASAELKRKG
jgi:NitT/TauT family transport system ATP-binding protein